MRNFSAFAALVAVLVGIVVTVVYQYGLPKIYAVIAIAIGAVLVGVRAIIEVLQRFRSPDDGGTSPKDLARAAKRKTRERVRALRLRLRELVRALKAAQDGPRLRYREAGATPWWLVLGPAGHGKSALALAAPAALEVAPGEPDAPRFFISRGAVFIELPAGHPQQPDDAVALAALLRDVRRVRPRQPLAGVLVAARADVLASADDDPAALLQPVRRQIDLVARALAVQVPVLLVVTQIDRVAGFAELVAGLAVGERPLGVTLPPREGPGSVQAAVRDALGAEDGILDWARQRCHALVARAQPGTQRQSRLYGFWQQFERLAARAAVAAGQLAAAPLPGGDPLRVRGVYFTGARPEPSPPQDQWLADLARRTGGALPPPEHDATPAPQPSFVAPLFTVEVPRDGQYAARLRGFYHRRLALAAALAILTAGAAAYVALGSTGSAQANHALMQDTLHNAEVVTQRLPDDPPPITELDALKGQVATWRAGEAPDGHGWGLFRGDRLADLVAAAFERAVCRGVLGPTARRSLQPLRQFAQRYAGGGIPRSREYDDTFARLRTYLLLSDPPAQGEPAAWSEDQRTWLIDQVDAAWTDLDGGRRDARRAAVLAAFMDLLPAAASRPRPAVDPDDVCARAANARAVARDEALVADVREVLNRNAAERDLVAGMTDRIARRKDITSVDMRNLGTASFVTGDFTVSPAFTRRGWSAFAAELQAELDQRTDQPWVRAREAVAETVPQRCDKLRTLYVARYQEAWEKFIAGLHVASPGSLVEAAGVFAELAESTPLGLAFQAVSDHTQGLPTIPCTEGKLTNMLSKLAPPLPRPAGSKDAAELAAHFEKFVAFGVASSAGNGGKADGALGLDSYHERLREVRSAIDKAIANAAEMTALKSTLEQALYATDELIKRSPLGGWKDRVARLLPPPLEGLHVLVMKDGISKLNQEWCASVVVPLQQTLAGRYPFAAGARLDARLDDVTLLFHPQTGAIARFLDDHLGGYVVRSGNQVEPRDLGITATLHLDGRVLALLDDAHKLGLLLFAADKPSLDLAVKMACERTTHKVELVVDDVQLSYLCTIEQTKSLHWPGKAEEHRATLTAYGINALKDAFPNAGEFSLLRLLERGAPQPRPGQTAFTLTFDFERFKLGKLQMIVNPAQVRGGNVFFGFAGAGPFLGPLRRPGFTAPPQALFAGHPFDCGAAGLGGLELP